MRVDWRKEGSVGSWSFVGRAAVAHNELPQATIIGGEQLVAELETMKLPELFPKAAAMGVSQAMIAASKSPHAQEMVATGTCAQSKP